jgi:phosphoglycolate phosphatase
MSQKIAIFDMDGTLVDSSIGITTAINLVRKELSLEPLSVDVIIEAINGNHEDLAFIFYQTKEYDEYHKELFESFYHEECIKNLYLYDGIYEMLCKLTASGVACSVATNAPAKFARRILSHLNIDHHFDHILGADSHKSKPNPDMINTILSNYGYHKERNMFSFMIGDSRKDINAALNASINPVHILWGFSDEMHESSVKHPKEIVKLLNIN